MSTSSRLENLRGSRPWVFLLGTRQVEAQLRGCDVPGLVPEVLKAPAGLSESQVRGMRDRQRHYVAKICGLTSSKPLLHMPLPTPKQQFASLWAGQVRWYGGSRLRPACPLQIFCKPLHVAAGRSSGPRHKSLLRQHRHGFTIPQRGAVATPVCITWFVCIFICLKPMGDGCCDGATPKQC